MILTTRTPAPPRRLRGLPALLPLALLLLSALGPSALAAPKAGDVWREPATGMEFAWVPGGCFDMGCGAWTKDCELYEFPAHGACVGGFWLGRFEVTQAQWRQVMGENPAFNRQPGREETLPVELVSWREAKEFAEKLSAQTGLRFRLPTEAEWEFAARDGGRPQEFPGGKTADESAWYFENARGSTHPVGTKRPNALGLHDMAGNVFEWCADVFDRGFYASAPKDAPLSSGPGQTPADWRARRGGSFGNLARDCRAGMRGKLEPGGRDEFTGLRLLREP